jgi:hypothetical protein
VDRLDRLHGGQATGHRLIEEDADEVAVPGADLLADQDRDAEVLAARDVTRLKGALDPIVIRDREVGQATCRRGPDDRRRRGERIDAGGRVAVQVDEGNLGPMPSGGVASVLGGSVAESRWNVARLVRSSGRATS